ncbi:MAG TPA: TIGR03767 family metallophosphoesterase [Actinomycetota bacterium]|nr:TIGR03767 family metallophosphoesterase [Actinomycetota bacterium]
MRGAGAATLGQTIRPGPVVGRGSEGAYRALVPGPGEPHVRRLDLAPGAPPPAARRSILHLLHVTDLQIVDVASPARIEFLDRWPDRREIRDLLPAHRAQEPLALHAFEAMIRAANALRRSPVTGAPVDLVVTTGDAIDNQQWNELTWFLGVLAGRPVSASGGRPYVGVQSVDWEDPGYWHPDPVPDAYKERWGYPAHPGLLDEAVAPFPATGLAVPWLGCFGNHEGLIQGTAIPTEAVRRLLEGGRKPVAPPPGFDVAANVDRFVVEPEDLLSGPTRPVPPDAARRPLTRRAFVEAHLRAPGAPPGHGFSRDNLERGTAYYVHDVPGVRLICLDTTNPGGFYEGSLGARQLAWLEERLVEVHSRFLDQDGREVRGGGEDRLVVVFSHHGPETLTNPLAHPNPLEPDDLPRILAPEVEGVLHRFPNVVLWLSGHTHEHRVRPRPDPAGRTAGFWDVTTAAVADWPCQGRLVELVDEGNGSLAIVCTVLDHAAPPSPADAGGPLRLASLHRELAANDPFRGAGGDAAGDPTDRNVELVLPRTDPPRP